MSLFLLALIAGILIGQMDIIRAPRWVDRLLDRELAWEERRRRARKEDA